MGLKISKTTKLDGAIIDKLWFDWLEGERERIGLTEREQYFLARRMPYRANGRRTNKGERFEQWLFTQGAEIRRVAGKLHLEFTDETQATLFALKYA